MWSQRRKKPNGAVAVLEADTPVVVKVPELETHLPYVTILDRFSGQKLVTVIEVVSPSNKYPGPGRESYVVKQKEIRRSKTHLVEIDLLRAGQHTTAVPLDRALEKTGSFDYHVCLHLFDHWEDYFVYPVKLQDSLPEITREE